MKPTVDRPRRILLALGLLVLGATATHGQGIPFVTRRTLTVEKQLPARRFFDAAGLPTAGADTNAVTSGAQSPALATTPAGSRQPGALGIRPGAGTASPAPALATRPGTPVRLPPPGAARGFIVPPTPANRVAPAASTNSPPVRLIRGRISP